MPHRRHTLFFAKTWSPQFGQSQSPGLFWNPVFRGERHRHSFRFFFSCMFYRLKEHDRGMHENTGEISCVVLAVSLYSL